MVITCSRVCMDQPGKVSPYAPENLVSRDRFSHPVPRQLTHSQGESGAYSRDSSRFPRRRPFIIRQVELPVFGGDRQLCFQNFQIFTIFANSRRKTPARGCTRHPEKHWDTTVNHSPTCATVAFREMSTHDFKKNLNAFNLLSIHLQGKNCQKI